MPERDQRLMVNLLVALAVIVRVPVELIRSQPLPADAVALANCQL